jgi:type I restriction enzyme M protein
MLVTGHDPEQIAFGNTLTGDAHKGKKFHYILSNPPYGVDWKKYQDPIKEEAETLGAGGRFGAGLPRISDGQLIFLQHMISKMRDDEIGSRIGIVMNGSPLFTGGAGSGESEIRRWMLENDWVEAIVALPTDLFYNTGIQTYVWLLTNRKPKNRRGKVQLIDGSSERFWKGMRKSLGSKRREIPEEARMEIVRIYAKMLNGNGEYGEFSKIFNTADFGYREIRVERPLRLAFQVTPERIEALKLEKPFLKLDSAAQEAIIAALVSKAFQKSILSQEAFEKELAKVCKTSRIKLLPPLKKVLLTTMSERNEGAEICRDSDGKPEADTELRDFELVPLNDDWENYMAHEVMPIAPDAWVDQTYCDEKDSDVGRVGYEINFNRYFYKYVAPRPVSVIDQELKLLEDEIAELLREVTG